MVKVEIKHKRDIKFKSGNYYLIDDSTVAYGFGMQMPSPNNDFDGDNMYGIIYLDDKTFSWDSKSTFEKMVKEGRIRDITKSIKLIFEIE